MNPPKKFSLPFVKKEQVAKDTFTFYFDRSKVDYNFIAGQYNQVTLPHDNPDNRGIKRFFSVSSSPNNKEFLTITTKILQSSFKKALFNITPGTQVSFEGPRGNFILKEIDKEYIFLVGGIGITPLLSILRFADEEKLNTKITVLVSFSTVEETIMYKQLKEIESRNPNIKVVYTLTHEENSSWTGETGRISEEMIKKYVEKDTPVRPGLSRPGLTELSKSYFYTVGPPAMVEGMLEIVRNLGILEEKIVKENFSGY